MNSASRAIVWVLITAALAGACNRVQPTYEVRNRVITTSGQGLDLQEIESRIIRAAQSLGWQVDRGAPGELRARTQVRSKHSAIVKIAYDSTQYSILYDSSVNLRAGDGTIHREYNNRVQALAREIDFALSRRAS